MLIKLPHCTPKWLSQVNPTFVRKCGLSKQSGLGANEGVSDGKLVGVNEGAEDGISLCIFIGYLEGSPVGIMLTKSVGPSVGGTLGENDESIEGFPDGLLVTQ